MKRIISLITICFSLVSFCSCQNPSSSINDAAIYTGANYTFFPTERTKFNVDKLTNDYENYLKENNIDYSHLGDYEVYSNISEEDKNKLNMDLFTVEYKEMGNYYVLYDGVIYELDYFSNINNNCITHIGITDVNNDGHIEILSASISFADRETYYYCTTFIKVIDTKTKSSTNFYDYNNIDYFKENEDGVLCIYNANGVYPLDKDLVNGKMDEKFYYLSTHLYDVPVLNTSKYEVKGETIYKKCSLYEVEVTFIEHNIYFPYLFEKSYFNPYFEVKVKMTYLGKPFTYTNPTAYLDGATVNFKNFKNEILYDSWGEFDAIEEFTIETGQVIERTYRYTTSKNYPHEEGVYDMIINYQNEDQKINKTMVVNNYLKITK